MGEITRKNNTHKETKHNPDKSIDCYNMVRTKRDERLKEDATLTRAVDTDPEAVFVTADVTCKTAEYKTHGHSSAFDSHHEVITNRPSCWYGTKAEKDRT